MADPIVPNEIMDGENSWLVVEDDDNDFILFRRACSVALKDQPRLHWVKNGKAAKAFLSSHPHPPKLVVSDLKMPQMNGLELLAWIRTQSSLKDLRFVMFTNSKADQDVQASKKFGVDEYRVKPSDSRDLVRTVKELSEIPSRPETRAK